VTGLALLFLSQHMGPVATAAVAAAVRGRGLTLLCLAALAGCVGGALAAGGG